MDVSNVTEWQALPLKEAYSFGIESGLKQEIINIKDMEIEWDLSYTSSLRRGFIVELFKSRGLLEDFETNHWPNGKTSDGERRKRRYLKIKQQYDDFLTSGQVSTIEPESEEFQEFAYETDLRDFLSRNLKVIEPSLSLYKDDISEGVEYPVDKGRIDILAKDRTGRFTVIELKVSRGR